MAFVIHLFSHLLEAAPPWVGGVRGWFRCSVSGIVDCAVCCGEGFKVGRMRALLSRRCDAWCCMPGRVVL